MFENGLNPKLVPRKPLVNSDARGVSAEISFLSRANSNFCCFYAQGLHAVPSILEEALSLKSLKEPGDGDAHL